MSDDNSATRARSGAAGSKAPGAVISTIEVSPDVIFGLLGAGDQNLKELESHLAADIHVRGNAVTLTGISADIARGR